MRSLLPGLRLRLNIALSLAASSFLWPIVFLIEFAIALWRFRYILLSFKGRVPRKVYWATFPIFFGYWVIIAGVIDAATQYIGASILVYWGLVIALVIVPLSVSAVAVGVKRLHDSNKSGWWVLVFYVVPAALVGIPGFAKASPVISGFGIMLSFPFLIWAIITLGCKRGTTGPNGEAVGAATTGQNGSASPFKIEGGATAA
jgi:uncharacterized membrane protein YhaH (DUF805 family)